MYRAGIHEFFGSWTGPNLIVRRSDIQIPITGTIHEVLFDYLCGADECNRHKGEKSAAEAVKKNILNGYFLIGILEDFENTLKLMEKLLPDYMKGIVDIYKSPVGQHVTETSATSHNTTVSNEVRDYLSKEGAKIDHITQFQVKFEDFFQTLVANNQFLRGENQTIQTILTNQIIFNPVKGSFEIFDGHLRIHKSHIFAKTKGKPN